MALGATVLSKAPNRSDPESLAMTTIESGIDLVSLLVSAIGTVGFTISGVLVDHAGIQHIATGNPTLVVWELWMGTLAVVVGVYLFGYRQFIQRAKALLAGSERSR